MLPVHIYCKYCTTKIGPHLECIQISQIFAPLLWLSHRNIVSVPFPSPQIYMIILNLCIIHTLHCTAIFGWYWAYLILHSKRHFNYVSTIVWTLMRSVFQVLLTPWIMGLHGHLGLSAYQDLFKGNKRLKISSNPQFQHFIPAVRLHNCCKKTFISPKFNGWHLFNFCNIL